MEEKEIHGLQEALHTGLPLPPSQASLPSQPSINSLLSIPPHSSIQSQHSGLLSQMSSLGFLPSLANLWPECAIEEIDHRCIATIKGERGSSISSLIVMGDYLYAGASSSDGSRHSIRILQKASLEECGGFARRYGPVKALVVAGDRILSAHEDLKIRVWSRGGTSRHRPKQVADGDNDLSVDLLQEMQQVAAGDSIDHSHKLLASMPTVRDYIKSFIPPKNYVQVRRHHKRLWIEHVDNISMLAVGGTAAGPLLYSASWDRTIKVWKLAEFRCIESFKAHDDAINALLVAPDGFLYSASADTKVKVWGRLAGSEVITAGQKHSLIATLDTHKAAVNSLALGQDCGSRQQILYSAGCDRCIVVWEKEGSGQHMVATGVLRGHRHAILSLVSRGSILCSGSADRTIRIWRQAPNSSRAEAGGLVHACIAILQGHSGPVKCLSLAHDAAGNHLLYSSSLDHEIKLWQLCGCVDEGEHAEMASFGHKSTDPKSQRIWRFHSV